VEDLTRRWCPNGNDGWGRIFDVKKVENVISGESKYNIPTKGLELIKEFEGCHLSAIQTHFRVDCQLQLDGKD
jgi:hypothetical protein